MKTDRVGNWRYLSITSFPTKILKKFLHNYSHLLLIDIVFDGGVFFPSKLLSHTGILQFREISNLKRSFGKGMSGGKIVITSKLSGSKYSLAGNTCLYGATGGVAFIYDIAHQFVETINSELVQAKRIDTDDTDDERYYLKKLLKEYYQETNSEKAKDILDNFRVEIRNFWMVRPKDMISTPLKIEEGE